MFADVSEERTATNFRVEEQTKKARKLFGPEDGGNTFFETSWKLYETV
jgi:hypothetical protein